MTDAVRKAGLWSVVLLSIVIFNLSYGLWEGPAWWRKHQEGGEEFAAKAQAGDLLLEGLYEPICDDLGAEAFGDDARKEEILAFAANGPLQEKGAL